MSVRGEVTRVVRLVFRLLGEGVRGAGPFRFQAYRRDRIEQPDLWVFGVRCTCCGSTVMREVTHAALENSIDTGEVLP